MHATADSEWQNDIQQFLPVAWALHIADRTPPTIGDARFRQPIMLHGIVGPDILRTNDPVGKRWRTMDKNINVLIVDDYRTMLRIIRNLLKQLEFNNVDEAVDGQEALAKLRAGNFGLVIGDWNMAPMTGLDLLKEVRADQRLKDMPFIMITGESKTENVVAAKQAGVSNYIVKPFNAETLREKIEKVLVHA